MAMNLENVSKLLGEPAYDRQSAAKELGCSVAFMDKLRRTGAVKAIYLGDIPIFTASALREAFKNDKEAA